MTTQHITKYNLNLNNYRCLCGEQTVSQCAKDCHLVNRIVESTKHIKLPDNISSLQPYICICRDPYCYFNCEQAKEAFGVIVDLEKECEKAKRERQDAEIFILDLDDE